MNPKPFHESIIKAIHSCHGPEEEAREVLKVLGNLIISTQIPENHKNINQAYKEAAYYWGEESLGGLIDSVSKKLEAEQAG